MAKKDLPNQESLMVVSERTGQVQVRDFGESEPGVASNNRIEQKIHLMNSLGYLATAKTREGLVTIGPGGEVADRYGDRASAVVAGAARKAVELKVLANDEFRQATAEPALIDAGVFPKSRIKQATGALFARFFSKYYTRPSSNKESVEYRKQLEIEIRDMQNLTTLLNRSQNLRPHKKDSKPSKIQLATEAFLDTPDRMIAIQGDDRAGFLPRSNAEKNMTITYLDYLDNPDYPLGITNQLFEVMAGLQKYRQPTPTNPHPKQWSSKDAIRAVESIVWQIGDYYADASKAVEALLSLDTALEDVSPRLRVHELEDIGKKHPGILFLIRSMNIAAFVRSGEVRGPISDPLAGTEVRSIPSSDRNPGRHKTVHDQYTRPDRAAKNPDFEAYLQERVALLTVKEARANIAAAVQNETFRQHFMWQRLQDVQKLERNQSMKYVLEAARESLDAIAA